MYLIFTVFWLVVAAAIFVSGDPRFVFHLGGASISSGWMALFFALYTLVRWWNRRSYLRQRRAQAEAEAERERRHREERRRQENAAPDPNFIFTDNPPAAEGEKQE